MRRAVFLDRDGTINEEMGYINHLSRFQLLPKSARAIARLNQAGLAVVVVTNQSGVARQYFPASLIEQVHAKMQELLAAQGARLDGIYVCAHGPEAGCRCRKPKPGLLEQAAQDLGIDLKKSYMVGDRFNDLQVAAAVGAKGILVLTGYGQGEVEHYQGERLVTPAFIAADLDEAVTWILADLRSQDDS